MNRVRKIARATAALKHLRQRENDARRRRTAENKRKGQR